MRGILTYRETDKVTGRHTGIGKGSGGGGGERERERERGREREREREREWKEGILEEVVTLGGTNGSLKSDAEYLALET